MRRCAIGLAIALLAVLGLELGSTGHVQHPPTRVSRCGTKLCLAGAPWSLAMATVYHGLATPGETVARIKALGLNTIRLTDFLNPTIALDKAPYDEAAWTVVDQMIAACAASGLHVELDFSAYRNLLLRAGRNPYAVDWLPFLRFVASRINTVTGLQYADDPTIALISFAGEVDGINGGENTYGLTTAALTEFYRTVEGFWHDAAPSQLLTAGGLSQLYWDSGIDWRAIFSLPYNDINALHVYTAKDVAITVPTVANFSRSVNKPWILEEFGFPARLADAQRAANFTEMFQTARNQGAAGIGLWNVGDQTNDTYDVGPQFPLTFQAVRNNVR